jgi:hypothetical protein
MAADPLSPKLWRDKTARPTRHRQVFRARQERDLFAWARENGRLINPADYLPHAVRGGEEHRLWPDIDCGRYWKATYPGCAGFTVIASAESGGLPDLTPALPLEYLERLALQNRVLGDDIRLERVAMEGNKMAVVTSQPIIVGQPATEQDISGLMTALWFKPLVGLHLGRPGSLGFYRELDDVAAFDAHPGNVVTDAQSIVLPIDLILLEVSPALKQAIVPFLK